MSRGRAIDDLARRLAEPMPRRRAVRLIGASIAAVALPGVSPRTARAASAADAPGSDCGRGHGFCWRLDRATGNIENRCCGYPRQRWGCTGPDGMTCVDQCPPVNPALHKRQTATWSAETWVGGTKDGEPKRYDCCIRPDTIPEDGKCLPNCRLLFGPSARQCGESCCMPGQLCRNGKCTPCPHESCTAPGGAIICCERGTRCCFNQTSVACCGPEQTCHAAKAKATCTCPKGTKTCGSECCGAGDACCGGSECCPPGRCSASGCCPEGRAMCRASDGSGKPVCCDEGEYCFWKADADPSAGFAYPFIGTCKRGCSPGNRAGGKQCCGTGFRPTKKGCVPAP